MAERMGCPVLSSLWSYVFILALLSILMKRRRKGLRATFRIVDRVFGYILGREKGNLAVRGEIRIRESAEARYYFRSCEK
jgi:hypothetical protein